MERYENSARSPVKAKPSSREQRLMVLIRYVLGGILTYGLLSLLLGWVLAVGWLWIPGVLVGTGGGIYLAYKHGFFRE